MKQHVSNKARKRKRLPTIHHLIQRAAQSATGAYAPYSRFAVGAAILTADGSLFTGANVENASYGLTICAERVAAFKAVSAGQTRFTKLAIVAGEEEAAWPCGACLQVLAEFSEAGLEIAVAARKNLHQVHVARLGELLPRAFRIPKG